MGVFKAGPVGLESRGSGAQVRATQQQRAVRGRRASRCAESFLPKALRVGTGMRGRDGHISTVCTSESVEAV